MKLKTLCLSALLLATVCQLAPVSRADYYNDGDWTCGNDVKWWWKYVFPGGIKPNWLKDITISDFAIDAARTIPGTFDASNGLTVTFKNMSQTTFPGGTSVMLVHTVRAADGSVRYSESLGRTTLPAMRSGELFRFRTGASTPAQLRGEKHFVEMQTR